MSDTQWKVSFSTESKNPCATCESIASSSPYIYITDRVELPDVEELRPHQGCECKISIDGEGLKDDSDYVVNNLDTDIESISEHQSVISVHSNPSRTIAMSVKAHDSEITEAKVSISTSYEVPEIATVEGRYSVSHTRSVNAVQTVVLEPRERVTEYVSEEEFLISITGSLVDKKTRQVLGATFVGTISQTKRTFFLDDIEPMD